MMGLMQVLLGVCFVAVIAGDERPFGQRIPLNTADCEAAGGKCVTQGYSSQCGSADYMCVGQCDSVEETCLMDKDDRCEKLRGGKCVEAIECVDLPDHGPCRFGCKNGRVCCVPDSLRSTTCWRGHRRGRGFGGRRGRKFGGGHGRGMGAGRAGGGHGFGAGRRLGRPGGQGPY
ncbi:hypothetical protein LSAT2_016674 [Lamellibrachia satsuma]|nr:hypothetical protein LSAT2_016674 [Lamellibrachia satsuma]